MNRRWAIIALAAAMSGCLSGTDTPNENGGTEIPNELVGKEIIAGKGPAVDAEIRLIPVSYVPGSGAGDTSRTPSYTVRTDASGRFTLRGALPGQYNLIASQDGLKSLRDSVPVTGKGQDLGIDTLKVPGSLYGTVVLQANHDPRAATVQVLGTTVAVNVDSAGTFLLPDLAPGPYRLRVETSLPGYNQLFAPALARSGRTDTLLPLRPFYFLTPVVTGLRAGSNRDGTLTLHWDRTSYVNADGYLIYRDTAGTILPSTVPVARVDSAVYVDTVYSKTPKAGQYPYLDTADHEITYRVRILDRSGDPGPAYAKVVGHAYPPGKSFVSGKWRSIAPTVPFGGRRNPALLAFKDRLWLIGGSDRNGTRHPDVWSSADGVTWTKELDSLPVRWINNFPATVLNDEMWIVAQADSSFQPRIACYSSPDGKVWTPHTSDNAPKLRSGMGFAAFKGKLWVIDGSPYDNQGIQSSPDGVNWTEAALPAHTYHGSADPGVAAFAGSLWRIGGGFGAESYYLKDIWRTQDGVTWALAADSSALGPRYAQRLVAAGTRLYSIGGVQITKTNDPVNGSQDHQSDLGDEVWASTDGLDWGMIDSHAPFGNRFLPGAAYFNGKIWMVGGQTGDSYPADVWVMDDP